MFCPKCKTIVLPRREGKDTIFRCSSCDKVIKNMDPIIRDKIKQTAKLTVMDGENHLAVHTHICPQCGHDKAEIIEKGIWYSDEDNVVIFKCGKCGRSTMTDAKVQ